MSINFDWSISLGTVVHLLGFVGTLIVVYIKLERRLVRMETMLAPLWRWWNDSVNGENRR